MTRQNILPEWGTKKNLMLFGALTFDGATFHFYSDKADSSRVGPNGPQLVITEKTDEAKTDKTKSDETKSKVASPEKEREKKVTFAIPHKKEYRYQPYPAEMPLSQFKTALILSPDKNSQDAAETLRHWVRSTAVRQMICRSRKEKRRQKREKRRQKGKRGEREPGKRENHKKKEKTSENKQHLQSQRIVVPSCNT